MGVRTDDIRPGKCFLSLGAKPQVVRVLAVRDGLVRFEARTRRSSWSGRGETALSEFAAGLLREVSSDYQPGATPKVHV